MNSTPRPLVSIALSAIMSFGASLPTQADMFHTTSGSIAGSLCVGTDCVTSENFGSDALRLKENVLRLHFDDTSEGAFPANDWRILINDITNGGSNYFGIQDATSDRMIVRFDAGAPANSIRVNTFGDVGIGEESPDVELHVKDGETPTLRLEQDGTSGFTPQIWDIAGNETNFFVRDLTGGTTLPFKVLSGAPTDAFVVDGDGKVGIGTVAPDYPLHVKRSDGTAQFRVEETSITAGNLSLMFLDNAGGRARLQMKGAGNPAQTGDWSISAGNTFVLQERGTPFNVMIVDQAGNMTIGGALTQNSDKNAKMAILPVDPDDILAKVAALPISAWTYKNDAESGIRHIGPMAQDFYAAFETGAGPTGISTIDTSGVALAAIKALAEENKTLVAGNEVLVADIKGLSQENAAQRDLIAQLAARLDVLEQQANR